MPIRSDTDVVALLLATLRLPRHVLTPCPPLPEGVLTPCPPLPAGVLTPWPPLPAGVLTPWPPLPSGEGGREIGLGQRWATADTRGLAELINFEGCALWLLRRVRQIGVAQTLDARLGALLAQRARDIAARNLLVDAETEAVLRFLAARAVPCVLLKGAARRALADRYPFAEARPTNDIDLLVPAAVAPAVWADLRAQGYDLVHPGRPPRPRHHHLPGLFGRAGVAVEIHTSVAPGIPADETWQRIRSTAITVERFGVPTLVPSVTELLWDGTMHAVRAGPKGFRLHHLLAVAGIGGDAPEELREVRARLPSGALASAWLDGAAWLAGLGPQAPPASLSRALRWRLALLRHLPLAQRMLSPLADEASRLEFGLLPSPRGGLTRGFGPLGVALMRNAYRCWRVALAS